jgi:hypothetical protein
MINLTRINHIMPMSGLPRSRTPDPLDRARPAVHVNEDVAPAMRRPRQYTPITPMAHDPYRFRPREPAPGNRVHRACLSLSRVDPRR